MCGRARATMSIHSLQMKFQIDSTDTSKGNDNSFLPIENMSPGMEAPVIFYNYLANQRDIRLMKWGLISSKLSSSSSLDHYKMFNARIETITEKVSYRDLLNKNRCIVVFDGFYEWKGTEKNKTPYYIYLLDDNNSTLDMSVAAVYDYHEATKTITFSILTCASCDDFKVIHDRQPVILRDEDTDRWLNPVTNIQELLNHINSDSSRNHKLMYHQVSSKITDPNYQQKNCSISISKRHFISSYFTNVEDKKLLAGHETNHHESIVCPICNKDILTLTIEKRELHVNSCIEATNDNDSEQQNTQNKKNRHI